MIDRGLGLELEQNYGDTSIDKADFEPAFFNNAETVSFKLNDEPVVRGGSSRMNMRARAGVMKPDGQSVMDADLQQLSYFYRGYFDNYNYTAGTGEIHTHEFWGGENKDLQSFRGIAVFDELKKYLYGLILNQLSLEVSDDVMSVTADWLYKTEKAGIIGMDGEDWERPDELRAEDLFIMFYDITLKLNGKLLDGISTSFKFGGNNNHNVDKTIGLGSRHPQRKPRAGKRENKLSITTTLTRETIRSILDAEYGEVGALEPSKCKLLQLPLEISIRHCENLDLKGDLIFPKCTLDVEYDLSGADDIEVTINLTTLGSDVVTLADGTTQVFTDVYAKLENYQEELIPIQ